MFFLLIFLLGTTIGSFLNVLVDRLPQGISPWKGRSFCDHCKKTLKSYDLIPLFSFAVLKGKCRYCHHKLSWQYPLLEILTGVIFVLTVYFLTQKQMVLDESIQYQVVSIMNVVTIIYSLWILSSFIVIFFTDLKYGIIPDKIVFPAILVTIAHLVFANNSVLVNHLLASLGAFLLFFALFAITRGKGMGFGDVKLVFLLGLFLGFPLIFINLYLSFLTGAIISLILVMSGKLKFKNTVPFGPFLIVCAIISYFLGDQIIKYIRMFF